jgi:phosphoribosylformylglycinamidine synthase
LVAIAEKSFSRGLGAQLALDDISEEMLFGEWPTRFVVTVAPEHEEALRELAESVGVPYTKLGTVGGDALKLGSDSVSVAELRRAYESALQL